MTGCDPIELTAADGARLTVRAHGAHATGWAPARGGERLWLSRDSGCGPGVAIRGGVPVIWPQFAGRGVLPKHGLARDRQWVVDRAGVTADGAAEVAFELQADDATRAVWPHRFTLVLVVRAAGDSMTFEWSASNDDDSAWSFTAALHTYFRVTDVAAATVLGVAGRRAEDNAAGGAAVAVEEVPLRVAGPLDLAIRDVGGPVTLVDPGLPDLVIDGDGLPDVVVWNPGSGQAPGDVHKGGEAEFVCIEPAVLTPVVLAPGGRWRAMATVRELATAG